MDYKLADLLDIPKLQALLDRLDEIYSIPSAIIDLEGNILTGTAWQDICTKFHRVHPESERECIESDTHIVSELSRGKSQVVYTCPKGLVDTATPIIVDGKHLGNAFTGQFFLEPPDEEHFRRLARHYGFDEEAYITAMKNVPVLTEEKRNKNLKVLSTLTAMLAEMGLQRLNQVKTEQALRESRESFKTLVESTGALHWEMDPETLAFIYVSPQIKEILGYSPDDWNTFESWVHCIHPDDRDWASKVLREHASHRKDCDFTCRMLSADGRILWVRDMVSMTSGHEGDKKIQGIMLNVTQLKLAEQERKRLNTRLMNKNRELQQILFVTSHDLRSPLVNIEGFSRELDFSLKKLISSLDAGEVPASVKQKISPLVYKDIPESLKFIHHSIAKMSTLISAMLKLSRTGSYELNVKDIDMNEVISHIVNNFEYTLKESGIETEISPLPACKGDKDLISQVFSNLIDNAIKYLDPARQGIIKVSGEREGQNSVYCVEDNGRGIPSDYQEKIFELFHRLEPGLVQGDGIGLTIIDKIVEKHNGRVWVESESDRGSKFFVSVPS